MLWHNLDKNWALSARHIISAARHCSGVPVVFVVDVLWPVARTHRPKENLQMIWIVSESCNEARGDQVLLLVVASREATHLPRGVKLLWLVRFCSLCNSCVSFDRWQRVLLQSFHSISWRSACTQTGNTDDRYTKAVAGRNLTPESQMHSFPFLWTSSRCCNFL